MDDQKRVVITVTVYPPIQGGRPVIVTAAPDGELPSVYRGGFADLHRLIDQVWIEVNTRKELVVHRARPDAKSDGDAEPELSGEERLAYEQSKASDNPPEHGEEASDGA